MVKFFVLAFFILSVLLGLIFLLFESAFKSRTKGLGKDTRMVKFQTALLEIEKEALKYSDVDSVLASQVKDIIFNLRRDVPWF